MLWNLPYSLLCFALDIVLPVRSPVCFKNTNAWLSLLLHHRCCHHSPWCYRDWGVLQHPGLPHVSQQFTPMVRQAANSKCATAKTSHFYLPIPYLIFFVLAHSSNTLRQKTLRLYAINLLSLHCLNSKAIIKKPYDLNSHETSEPSWENYFIFSSFSFLFKAPILSTSSSPNWWLVLNVLGEISSDQEITSLTSMARLSKSTSKCSAVFSVTTDGSPAHSYRSQTSPVHGIPPLPSLPQDPVPAITSSHLSIIPCICLFALAYKRAVLVST